MAAETYESAKRERKSVEVISLRLACEIMRCREEKLFEAWLMRDDIAFREGNREVQWRDGAAGSRNARLVSNCR